MNQDSFNIQQLEAELGASRSEISKYRAALEAVLAEHADGGMSQGFLDLDEKDYGVIEHACTSCGKLGEFGVEWPCATAKEVMDALGQ